MNYCSLKDAWSSNAYISNQFKEYMNPYTIEKNIENFTDLDDKTPNLNDKQHIARDNTEGQCTSIKCDDIINHLKKCKKCNRKVKGFMKTNVICNLEDIINDAIVNKLDFYDLSNLSLNEELLKQLLNQMTNNSQKIKYIVYNKESYNRNDLLEIDKKYIRPTEVDALIGDPSKAQRELGWSAKTHWQDLAKLMVDADLELGKS
jgi:hypothetical protein